MSKSKQLQKLKPSETIRYIEYIIKLNRKLQEEGKKPIALEIIGDAGLGKTTIAKDVSERLVDNFVKLNLAQIEELGDLVGFPIKQYEMCQMNDQQEKLGDCIWAAEAEIHAYETEGYKFTGKNRMSYAPPEWIAGLTGSGVLLLDDWTRADPRFIQACMELIDRQEYISWRLPKNWTILLSSNPSNGEYTVTEIDEAQKTRFLSIELKFDEKEWAQWAEFEGIDDRCINFLLKHPEIVKNKGVNPRSLVNFFNSISAITDFSTELDMVKMLGDGSVGDIVSSLFVTFIHNKLDKLPTPEEIMNMSELTLVETMKKVVGSHENQTFRSDISAILALRLTNYSLALAQEKAGERKIKLDEVYFSKLEKLVKGDIFGRDSGYHMVKTLFKSGSQFRKLTENKELAKLVTE